MDSNKNKTSKPLILEARHTKSLAASKETRQKFAQSMFIPRRRYYRSTTNENLQIKTLRNFENSEGLAMQLKGKYYKKLMCTKKRKTIESNNNNKCSQNSNKCRNMPTFKVAKQNSRKLLSKRKKRTPDNTSTALNTGKLQTANEISASSDRRAADSDLLTIESFLNLHKDIKATSTDPDNANNATTTVDVLKNDANKISDVREIVQMPANSNQCKGNNLSENPVKSSEASPQIPSESIVETSKSLTNKEAVNTSFRTNSAASKEIGPSEKLKDKHSFDSLFKADLQNVIRLTMPPANDYSPIERQISYDLWMLDNCAKNFCQCIWQIHQDLDDKEKDTRESIEYARKKETERAKLLQSNRSPPIFGSKPVEKVPKTFTIFIEAANFPKKSITFKTADVLGSKPISNNDSFQDINLNTAKSPQCQRNPNKNPQTALSSCQTRRTKPKKRAPAKTKTRQKSKAILEQNPQKVQPIKPIPLNAAGQSRTASTSGHFNYNTQTPMYNSFYGPSNHYNYWPESDFHRNSWLAAREEWLKGNCYSLWQNFHGEPTVEVPAGNLQPFQCHNISLPPSYSQAVIESNIVHYNRMTNYLPTYQESSIQLAKY